MLRAYKYRLYPNKTQTVLLNKTFGCVRLFWNKCVDAFNKREQIQKSTAMRTEFLFMKEVSAAAIQQKERDFLEYKKQFFNKGRNKKVGRPAFKKRNNRQSFRLPNQKFSLVENRIRLEKIGWVKVVVDRPYNGKEVSATISKDNCGDYYVSILVDTNVEAKIKTNKTVGIDMGVKKLIITSDGLQVNSFSENQRKIKHIQRRLSNKKKGSNNFLKLKKRLSLLYCKEQRRRNWLSHNLSLFLVENYDKICVEDLNVSGMVKNHKLARVISQASWTTLINQIEYKCKFYGKELIKIGRFYPSSKTCSQCGNKKDTLKLSERTYVCENCGLRIDRDLNAAINIKAVGVDAAKQSVMGCKTGFIGQTMKQAIPSDLISFL